MLRILPLVRSILGFLEDFHIKIEIQCSNKIILIKSLKEFFFKLNDVIQRKLERTDFRHWTGFYSLSIRFGMYYRI